MRLGEPLPGLDRGTTRIDLRPIAFWGLGALILNLALYLDASMTGFDGEWFSRWTQFDGIEYIKIAEFGYEPRSLVWFPLYPSLIRVGALTGADPAHVGMALTALFGAIGAVLLGRWLRLMQLSPGAQAFAIGVALTYPYGWYLYGAVHSDSLFLALVLGAFLAVEDRRWAVAGIVGALATAARPTGIVLIVPLLVRALEVSGVLRPIEASPSPEANAALIVEPTADDTNRWPDWVVALKIPVLVDRSAFRRGVMLPAMAVVGVGLYMAYSAIRWSRPLGFATEQVRYHGDGWRLLIKKQYFDAWSQGFDGRHLATTTAQMILLIIVLLSVGAVGRRFGWGYGLFVAGLGVFPGLTVSTFMGIGRYLIPAFPLWALFGEWLSKRRWLGIAYVVTSPGVLVWLTIGFGRSWYLT